MIADESSFPSTKRSPPEGLSARGESQPCLRSRKLGSAASLGDGNNGNSGKQCLEWTE